MKSKKPKSDGLEPSYQPSSQEETALRKYLVRHASKTAPRVKVKNDGGLPKLSPDHPDEAVGYMLLMEAVGTDDMDFLNGLLGQLANAGSQGRQFDEGALNFMLSVVKAAQPKDQLEAMLAAQMAAVHMATMTFARRLQHVDNLPQQDSAERAFNKLTRTYTTQMEALKRYRTGGEQKVTVQHVSVGDGGQAIVGNVTQSPRESPPEMSTPAPLALTDTRIAPMPIIEDSKERVGVRRRSDK
jgi:hypothetical protein